MKVGLGFEYFGGRTTHSSSASLSPSSRRSRRNTAKWDTRNILGSTARPRIVGQFFFNSVTLTPILRPLRGGEKVEIEKRTNKQREVPPADEIEPSKKLPGIVRRIEARPHRRYCPRGINLRRPGENYSRGRYVLSNFALFSALRRLQLSSFVPLATLRDEHFSSSNATLPYFPLPTSDSLPFANFHVSFK